MFATVWQRYEARQPNSFIVAQLSVYCCLSLLCQDFSFSFFFGIFTSAAQKMHIENCANKSGENAVNFPLCCAMLCCLRLACHWQTVSDVAFCFATAGCSSYINICEFPSYSQCPASEIDTLSDEVWLMWPRVWAAGVGYSNGKC